uniref:prolyl oligopeptidase family serine peptidase n=1 Tax=Acidicapsa acidisoli TaxID=1615681 RepID=UPI0037C0A176
MVRYELFDRAARWRGEYSSTANPNEFQALYGYSPYHRVKSDVNYPAMLFVTGDQDDRCNPAYVRKMAARLGLTITTAHRKQRSARAILVERREVRCAHTVSTGTPAGRSSSPRMKDCN